MNDKNLIPNAERTPEELREITRKGGIASGVARRKKADLRKQLEMLGSLRMEVTPNVAKILDGMDKDISIDRDNLTNETMVLIALMQKATMKFMFTNLKDSFARGGVDLNNYRSVWSGLIFSDGPEKACDAFWWIFNQSDRPNARCGHSMSVSDIIKLTGADGKDQYWFVDDFGFRMVTKEE